MTLQIAGTLIAASEFLQTTAVPMLGSMSTYLGLVLVRKSCTMLPLPTVLLPFVQLLGDFSVC